MFSARTILCPLDLQASSFIPLAHAVQWANFYKSRLLLVHVIDYLCPSRKGEDVLFPTVKEGAQRAFLETQSKLRHLVDKRGAQIPPTQLLLRFGDPAPVIADLSHSEAVDLIVLGRYETPRHSSVYDIPTTERVLRLSSCAVLTVPLPILDLRGTGAVSGTGAVLGTGAVSGTGDFSRDGDLRSDHARHYVSH